MCDKCLWNPVKGLDKSSGPDLLWDRFNIDVSYAAPQAHGIINVALHREYFLGIIFIFSQGRKYLYHV
jgi:hypothetical protein